MSSARCSLKVHHFEIEREEGESILSSIIRVLDIFFDTLSFVEFARVVWA